MEAKKFEILIIDDNHLTRKIIIDMLKPYNEFEVFDADSVWTAIRKLGNHQIDLILLDIYMPDINGFEAVKIFRAQARTENTTVVFMTAQDPNKEFLDKALSLGGIDYLLKPFNELELLRLIRLYKRFILREREINKAIQEANDKLKAEMKIRIETEESLRISEAALKKSNLAKDRFFSILAHDLINPFSVLLNVSELLNDSYADLEPAEVIEMHGFLKTTTTQTYALLQNLLEWSRTQLGHISYKPIVCDLFRVVESQVNVLSNFAANKNIKLINKLDENLSVYTDDKMIQTVIRNLISNAIKFTNEGGTIQVLAVPYLDFNSESVGDDKFIEVVVKDDGLGIAPEIIEKLFKEEEKHTSYGTNNEKGTGLGLLLCKEFVVANGGKIWVESKLGYGSEFKFTVPSK